MAPYFGLTGRKLHAAIWTEACVAVSLFGYSGSSIGGVLDSSAFRKQFPTIDVLGAAPDQAHHVSTIQGS